MARRAEKLRKLLAASKKTADQAQKSFLKSEDVLASLEERKQRRRDRERP
jgi:hypothetical protein